MEYVLWLLFVLSLMGGFDTFYFHEFRARLPAQGGVARTELRLHALRSSVYSVLVATLPYFAWGGRWAGVLVGLMAFEFIITMTDFVVEVKSRAPLGGLYYGEIVNHAMMGIVWGAMLACLAPVVRHWWSLPTDFVRHHLDIPPLISRAMLFFAPFVFAHALRDLYASFGLPYGHWPWTKASPSRKA
jgi:hypothetical protein